MNATVVGLAALFAALTSTHVTAATVIKTKELSGHVSIMTVQGAMARIGAQQGHYVIVDAKKQKFYAVNDQRRQVTDLTQDLPKTGTKTQTADQPTVHTEIKHVGAGPRIASYPTEHYKVFANGNLCEETWLSPQATKQAHLAEFLGAFYGFFSKQRRAYRRAGMQYSPCDEARAVATKDYRQLGMAMKTVLPDGTVRQRVLSVKTGVDVPASEFRLPNGYRVMSREEAIERLRKKRAERYKQMKRHPERRKDGERS